LSLRIHNYREVLKALKHFGFYPESQVGSHIQLKHADGRRLTAPRDDVIKIGVIKSIISYTNIPVDEFLKYL
jgi:predicted RNA binding protein YcfA (HicA-like mRNA interferase family)